MSPLGEDDGILLLPLQAATLGNLAGLRGDIVLQRQRREIKFRNHRVILARPSVSFLSSPLPLLLFSTAPLDRGASLTAQALSSTAPAKVH